MSGQEHSIFISRELISTSPIKVYCDLHGLSYTTHSLINFSAAEFEKPNSGWLFFYSKSGVKYFLESKAGMEQDYKVGTFGKATAAYYKSCTGRDVDYIGNVDKVTVANDLVALLGKDTITFVVGNQSLRSVQGELDRLEQSWTEAIVYKHAAKNDVTLGSYTIAVLTSPMNVASFVMNGGIAKAIIVIGTTTLAAIQPYNTAAELIIAAEPTEEGIVSSLRTYIERI